MQSEPTDQQPPSSDPLPDDRLVAIELLITHLQHDLEQMHSVLLSQQTEIDALKQRIAQFETRMEQMDATPEQRDLNDERPPHY